MPSLNDSSILIDNWVVTLSEKGDSISIVSMCFFKDKDLIDNLPKKSYGSKRMNRLKLFLLSRAVIWYYEL